MRIYIGADHAGFEMKEKVRDHLKQAGHDVVDVGTDSPASVDYPDYAIKVARAVRDGVAERGVLVCGSGIGMAIAANKFSGIRAAPVVDLVSARLSRQHNDVNVLALGARVTPPDAVLDIVKTFLDTPFEGGRHQRRLDKITRLETGTPANLNL